MVKFNNKTLVVIAVVPLIKNVYVLMQPTM